jgi:hypothetical protein
VELINCHPQSVGEKKRRSEPQRLRSLNLLSTLQLRNSPPLPSSTRASLSITTTSFPLAMSMAGRRGGSDFGSAAAAAVGTVMENHDRDRPQPSSAFRHTVGACAGQGRHINSIRRTGFALAK